MIGGHGRGRSGRDRYGIDIPIGAGLENKSQKGVLCKDGIEKRADRAIINCSCLQVPYTLSQCPVI